jgi:predicted nucleotidyltransferase
MTLTNVTGCMSNRETVDSPSSVSSHGAAAEAFATRARSQFDDEIAKLSVFGSTVRGEARGLASDVDVLVVLDDTADQKATADALRDLAYEIMLEFGPVVELHIFSESAFERARNEGNPFIKNIVTEGHSYA